MLVCLVAVAGLALLWRVPRAFAYEAIEVANPGKILGVVTVSGDVPVATPVVVNKNREVCGKQIKNERLVVGPHNGLRYAVVTLADITKGKAADLGETHPLDNKKCAFAPHVQAVTVGQMLDLKNTDPILHDFDAILSSGQTLFNVGMWPDREVRRPVAYTGILHVTCYIHKWMSAYMVVTEHPYHAVTDLYGNYEIDDVPPGTYKVRVWHELLGTAEKPARVAAGGKSEINFTLKAGEK